MDNIKQALESALSERVPAASPDEIDSGHPPEKLLEAMRQLWAQSVAQRAAAKASEKDAKEDAPLQKQARSGQWKERPSSGARRPTASFLKDPGC